MDYQDFDRLNSKPKRLARVRLLACCMSRNPAGCAVRTHRNLDCGSGLFPNPAAISSRTHQHHAQWDPVNSLSRPTHAMQSRDQRDGMYERASKQNRSIVNFQRRQPVDVVQPITATLLSLEPAESQSARVHFRALQDAGERTNRKAS